MLTLCNKCVCAETSKNRITQYLLVDVEIFIIDIDGTIIIIVFVDIGTVPSLRFRQSVLPVRNVAVINFIVLICLKRNTLQIAQTFLFLL